MLESFKQQFRRGAEQLQRRSGEVTQGARLRLAVYQLLREQDALYTRLGRAYYSGVDQSTLDDLRAEIRQLEQDIMGSENLMTELGDDTNMFDGNLGSAPLDTQAAASPPTAADSPQQPTYAVKLEKQPTHPRWSSHEQGGEYQSVGALEPLQQPATTTAGRIWRAKERERQQGEE